MKKGSFLAEEKAEAPALEKHVAHKPAYWHRWIERKPVQMLVASLGLLLVGTLIELVPTFLVESNIPTIASVKPYTPLELEGRDLYLREGCYTCHSQMVRPFRNEELRYKGEYSKAGEFVYDHPFQWGSKRTGPDLHRVGGRWGDDWHFRHMMDPQSVSPGSIMPPYPHMIENDLDTSYTIDKLRAMQTVGVPYSDSLVEAGHEIRHQQAVAIAASLEQSQIKVSHTKEIIALIAYLQRLGTDIKTPVPTEAPAEETAAPAGETEVPVVPASNP